MSMSSDRVNKYGTKAGSVEQALTVLANLEAAGRDREALAFATEQSRLLDDLRFYQETMRLRRRAFVPGHGRRDWPPNLPDYFPGVRIPETQGSNLSADLLGSAIEHHGALVVRGLLGGKTASQLRDLIDEVMCDADHARRGVSYNAGSVFYSPCPDTSAHPVSYGRSFTESKESAVLAGDSPRAFAALVDLYENNGVFQAVQGYLGERPVLSLAKTVLRRVPTDAGTAWHQDGAFLGVEIRVVNTWITLSDCGVDAPGLDIVARRLTEVLETGTAGAGFDWSVGPETLTRHGLDRDIVSPAFEAGDAIMFDHLTLHRTSLSPQMTRSRYAVEAWMFAPSAFPMESFPLVV